MMYSVLQKSFSEDESLLEEEDGTLPLLKVSPVLTYRHLQML